MQEPCTFSFVISKSADDDAGDDASQFVISGINLGFALATLAAVATRHHVACCGNNRAGGGGLDLFLVGSLALQSFFLWSVASTVREFLGTRLSGIWNLLKLRFSSFFKKRGGGDGSESRPSTRPRRNIRESWKVGTIHVEA
ncbi:hypothetical protein V8F06_011754 [Rhypophila decipiens]